MIYFSGTDRGVVRRENEDSYLLHIPDDEKLLREKGILAVVADGVGGGPAGKQASSMAVEVVKNSFYSDSNLDNSEALKNSIRTANRKIFEASHREPRFRGMATTCTAFAFAANSGFIAHVGDSRAYLLRQKELQQLSKDHTLVNELVEEGIISHEEARRHPQRNIILKAVGSTPDVVPDAKRIDLESGDIVLLCSDGLHGLVRDSDIASVLNSYPVDKAGKKLIDMALDAGGTDNITVVVFSI